MKRLNYIDTAKGILILLVVIGHIVPENSILRTWIWSFHMPAFFIISGILINHSSFTKKSFSELIISSIKSLIIPFVIFEIIGAIADRIMHGSSLNVKGYIYNSITLRYNNVVDWFLITLFISRIIVFLVIKIKNKNILLIICLCFFILGAFNFNPFICRLLISSSFIIFGYLFNEKYITKNIFYIFLSFLFTSIIAFINGRVDLNGMTLHNPILYAFTSTIGTISVLSFSKNISNKFISLCGKNSIIIMGIHSPLIGIVKSILYK